MKTSGGTVAPAATAPRHIKKVEEENDIGDSEGVTDNPPWLRPPNGYKPGAAAAAVSTVLKLLIGITNIFRFVF